MNTRALRRFSLAFLALLFVALAAPSVSAQHGWSPRGDVYTMSNDANGNEILAFDRAADGSLSLAATYPTGGLGSGAGLGNQGGLVLSRNGRWLVAVNAGSNSISVFRRWAFGLLHTDTVPSLGLNPVSVTISGHRIYVLNAGGSVGDADSIHGFKLDHHGDLHPIPNSQRPLSAASTAPAQISFSPNGRALVVTEKATNIIDVYRVNHHGRASLPTSYPSEGTTPFGFSFGRGGRFFVAEAAGAAAGATTVSAYRLNHWGILSVLSSALPTTQTAACWLATTRNGRTLYTTNTPSGTVSGLRYSNQNGLELLDPSGVTANTGMGSAPIDLGLSRNDRFLYTLNGGNGTIGVYERSANGSLVHLGDTPGLPATANGLAVR